MSERSYHRATSRSRVKDRVRVRLVFREGRNVLFNDALNTFYLWLYGIRHNIVKNHLDSETVRLLPLHGLPFPISSKGSFICTIPYRVEDQWVRPKTVKPSSFLNYVKTKMV